MSHDVTRTETKQHETQAPSQRFHDLDALRGFAMLLGIVLHASLSFLPGFWPAEDNTASFDGPYDEILHFIHGFRMPLFFLLSGFFTAMLWRRRGLRSLLSQRVKRVALPLAIAMMTIIPLMNWVSDQAIAAQIDDLLIGAYTQNTTAVEDLLTNGAHPDKARGSQGETPLHAAAVLDDAEIAELLLEAGADPVALDIKGDSPLAWAYYSGSEEVADLLIAAGHPEIRPGGTDWEDLDNWGFGASESDEDDVGLESWVASFHHLWFLWFILWLVAGFAVIAAINDSRLTSGTGVQQSEGGSTTSSWPGRLMWVLIPLTLLPQFAMGEQGEVPTFGPDTSIGVVPLWHVLAYYAVFFGFGALAYARKTPAGKPVIEVVGRGWMIILAVTVLVVFPVALGFTFDGDWYLASILQVSYAWAMIFGLLGAFRAWFATERRGVRYLSDSSYWLYIVHLPLVIWLQSWISEWDLPSGVKFVGLNVTVGAFLLLTYRLFVRYTPIGTLLNGKRIRPDRAATAPGT